MYNSQPATNTPDFSYAGVTSEATANAISFYGEIQNKSTLAQAKIYVVVTLLDANGQELGTARKLAERGYLLPGETAPFYVLFFRDAVPRVKFTSYRIAIESEPADTFARGYYLHDGLDLAVSEVGQDGTGDYPVVRGVFNNQRSTAVNYPKIIAVFYNEAGEVIGITDCYAKGRGEKLTLAAGTSAPFETIFFSLTERDPTAYMLYAEASRP
jgi:hypothetical protein